MKYVLDNARLLDPASGNDGIATLIIEEGKVSKIIKDKSTDNYAEAQKFDLSGKVIMPGLVDLCSHLKGGNDPYHNLNRELNAAVAGGITSLVLSPDTQPILDEPGLVDTILRNAQDMGLSKVYPLGALTMGLEGEVLAPMATLKNAGCIGFSQSNNPLINLSTLNRAMRYARTHHLALWLQASEPNLTADGVMASGAYASRLGLKGIPVQAETIALNTLFALQKSTMTTLHISNLTSAEGISIVREAKKQGLPVTCDVSINNLTFIDQDVGFFDSHFRLSPPLRSQKDRSAITEGLLDGTIDAISSNHMSVSSDHKQVPFAEAQAGAVGFELLLSSVIKWSLQNNVALLDAISFISNKPGQILSKQLNLGSIHEGMPADLICVDLETEWVPSSDTLSSLNYHTPFLNYPLPAKVNMTFVGGKLVFNRE
ncbi:dihydroorotase [Taylorella equigenitalis 14/56]|uniref:Dihydroorotase n=2 Tax=Taylorella equigenitalis TaxID=29575 RepID=A0A654KG41_TAYEM|nr:dihydroorotase [Taylorella equigenitalis]ADU91359.1 Dihydroorotase [Taylorella equigenitalis MCE9]ASY42789.1 dihydroorotase [Taylorella equigenitalis]RBA26517.1 dihydroorotase [Taylorella equigenitalis]WDU49206.1 dihydroorotase [Taylorella equigenitalis]WDU51679.1 dihydroorotase [Taylorella equigenitalis]